MIYYSNLYLVYYKDNWISHVVDFMIVASFAADFPFTNWINTYFNGYLI